MNEHALSGFRRHDLVRLKREAWSALLTQHQELTTEPLLPTWIHNDYPLIVRRTVRSDAAGRLPLGMPLPPSANKKRWAVIVCCDGVSEHTAPPLLSQVRSSAPAPWQPTLSQLIALDPDVRVFGSLAWQHLTRLSYITSESDLDLLWTHSDAERTALLLGSIEAIQRDAAMRIDGEMIGKQGVAVHWRELLSGADAVLGKSMSGVALLSRTAFMSGAEQ